MKTIRLFFAAMMVLLVAVGISDAKDKKTTEKWNWPWNDFNPCANEIIVGEESCVVIYWDGKYQCRYEGTYAGQTSGKSYSWSAFEILSYTNGKASNETYIVKMVLKCEGVPIATCNYKYHITINPNGIVTVEKEKGTEPWVWICKD